MVRPPPAAVFRQLLDETRLSEASVRSCLDRAIDKQYWRGLAPGLHVGDPDATVEPAPASDGDRERSRRSLREEGLFELRHAISADALRRLNAGIDAVVEAGWPAVFVFVYDECWLCARAPAILRI